MWYCLPSTQRTAFPVPCRMGLLVRNSPTPACRQGPPFTFMFETYSVDVKFQDDSLFSSSFSKMWLQRLLVCTVSNKKSATTCIFGPSSVPSLSFFLPLAAFKIFFPSLVFRGLITMGFGVGLLLFPGLVSGWTCVCVFAFVTFGIFKSLFLQICFLFQPLSPLLYRLQLHTH